MNLGIEIKSLRQKKNLKQVELSTLSGLSQSYLSLIEKGEKKPTLDVLTQIAKALSIPMPVLVFCALDENDVEESKLELFRQMSPSIKSLISDIFISETNT